MIAIRYCDTTVQCISHCNLEEKEISQNEEVILFDFEELYNALSTKEKIQYSPNDAKLRFGKSSNKAATLTISSKAAKFLFIFMATDPFDSKYETLNFASYSEKG